MREVHALLDAAVAERVIFDFGLVGDLGYYTGAVFEVYDPAHGVPIGGGGQYDDLLGGFGRRLPAVGFALGVELLHVALAGEERAPWLGHAGGLVSRRRPAIAVPRGALFAETLDLLDRLGLDTAEVRANDRKLLFEDIGSHHDAPVGRARRMSRRAPPTSASPAGTCCSSSRRPARRARGLRAAGPRLRAVHDGAGDRGRGDPAADALRRLGVMRDRDQVSADRDRALRATGRQAEIVEVKGSVELAPLTGLVEAIVDLTATGTTLRENNLVVREEIVVCTARLIANPVADKLKAAEIDDAAGRVCVPVVSRLTSDSSGDAGRAARGRALRALVPDGARSAARRRRDHRRRRRAAATRRCSSYTRRLTPAAPSRAPLLVTAAELDAAIRLLPLELVAGLQARSRTSRASPRRASAHDDRASSSPQGHSDLLREVPVPAAAVYVPGGRAPYPSTVVMGVVTARAAGVIDVVVCAPPGADGQIDPVILGTCRLCGRRARLPDGRRAGDRRARATAPRPSRRST